MSPTGAPTDATPRGDAPARIATGSVVPMRRPTSFRPLALTVTAALALAACGGSDSSSSDETTDATTEEVADEPADDEGAGGADDDSGDGDADEAADEGNTDKPEVDFPGEAPDELVVTVLVDGSGAEAEAGDTVVVDYIGVRSLDGEEFDNSYDRGQPFPVVLGQGGVIQGWDEGLVGVRAGDRIQLDIPSDLAYGETARSEVIRENEPLTFVIDVRSVISVPDASTAPTDPGVELSEGDGVDDTVFVDLIEGDGEPLEFGDTAVLHFVYYRGDNGVELETSWAAVDADGEVVAGQPITVPFIEGQLIPGLAEGLEGMQVGGRRAITIPPEDGFGPDGDPQAGLPADTDIIFVVDLIGAY